MRLYQPSKDLMRNGACHDVVRLTHPPPIFFPPRRAALYLLEPSNCCSGIPRVLLFCICDPKLTRYLDGGRILLEYKLPWQEVVSDLHDQVLLLWFYFVLLVLVLRVLGPALLGAGLG